MDLVALASFNRVASHGGFGQASRATGQPKATLSRHVRELEEHLCVRLIERGPRSLRLTADGAALHARTTRLLAELEEAGAQIAAGLCRPQGLLRVSVPILFAQIAMGKLGAAFAARYPEVSLDVTAEDRRVDLLNEGYDVVVRINPKPDHGLVGQCFLYDETLVVAPASFGGTPNVEKPPFSQPIPAVALSAGLDAELWKDFDKSHGQGILTKVALRLPSLLVVRDAVRAGAGIALLPRSIVAEDLADGRLVCWGLARDRKVEVWALHLSRRLVSRKVAAFMSFLTAAFPDKQL